MAHADSQAAPEEGIILTLAHLLCPVDFSDTSAHALAHAAMVARSYQSRITALHVHTPIAANVPDSAEELRELRERVHAFARHAIGPEVDVAAVVDVGQPWRRIVAQAAWLDADLIVLGTNGLGGLEHLLVGSVTERVLRQARSPVLTVPPRAQTGSQFPLRRILCAVDFSESSLSALDWSCSLAQASGATVCLLHVIEWPWNEPPAPRFDALPAHEAEQLAAFRQSLEATCRARLEALVPANVDRCSWTVAIRHGRAHRQLLAAAADWQADLIVMGVRGRDAVDLAVFGSTTNEAVRGASCPVLSVRTAH